MNIETNQTEIFKDIFRLMVAPSPHFEFNQFLIQDKKTCLIHTGKASLFKPLKEMADNLLGERQIDYIIFSHFEADECGSVNDWLAAFPKAQVYCNKVANINLGDFLIRPAIVLKDGESLSLGKRSLKLIDTPHFPHNWDAHMWLEETENILFSSDFCCHGGISEPVTEKDISEKIIDFYEKGNFIPYGKSTNLNLEKLESFNIEHIVPMHGPVIKGSISKQVFEKVSMDLKSRA